MNQTTSKKTAQNKDMLYNLWHSVQLRKKNTLPSAAASKYHASE